MAIRSRIKKHVRVKASELVPHELNPRVHSQEQREALKALYEEVGFARSLLAYETKDGKLKLIDGHLRQSMDPDMEVDVEILDVNDEEARKLLLSLDPLAQLADFDNQALDDLRKVTETDNETLSALWSSIREQGKEVTDELNRRTQKVKTQEMEEQYLVTIRCQSEQEQVALLRRMKKEGWNCTALTS